MANDVDERLRKLDDMIAKLEGGLGLTFEKPDVSKYLNAGVDDIKRMTPEDCASAAIVITRYSGFIQQNYNRALAKATWASDQIKKHIAPRLKQYFAPTAEERRTAAILDDEFTRKLDQVRAMSQMNVDILQNLSYQIKALADKFDSASHAKRNGRV